MKRIVLSGFVAILLTACLDTPTAPPAGTPNLAVVTNERTDLTGTVVFNECNGEDVLLQGIGHLVVTDNPQNGTHFQIHIQAVGLKGIGLSSGLEYVWVEQSRVADVFLENGAGSGLLSAHLRAVSKGAAENYELTFIVRGTQNSNGEQTSFRLDPGTITCR